MLSSRSGSSPRSAAIVIFVCLVCAVAFAGEKKKGENKPTPPPTTDLTAIPLPVGHEAKGLVLPNFDADGKLTAKLEAGAAKRIDENHVLFTALKLTTFTPQSQPDLSIEMLDSVFDLKTRVVVSQHRATIKRADFDISGDAVEFDTVARHGKLVGNVKMVITAKNEIQPHNDGADD
jgi:lipopolysaccharide export system protein LptC